VNLGGLESGVLALVERTRSDDRTPQNLISGATSWSQAALRPYSWRLLARRLLRFGDSGRLVCDARFTTPRHPPHCSPQSQCRNSGNSDGAQRARSSRNNVFSGHASTHFPSQSLPNQSLPSRSVPHQHRTIEIPRPPSPPKAQQPHKSATSEKRTPTTLFTPNKFFRRPQMKSRQVTAHP
jgi:hypothetical protein